MFCQFEVSKIIYFSYLPQVHLKVQMQEDKATFCSKLTWAIYLYSQISIICYKCGTRKKINRKFSLALTALCQKIAVINWHASLVCSQHDSEIFVTSETFWHFHKELYNSAHSVSIAHLYKILEK